MREPYRSGLQRIAQRVAQPVGDRSFGPVVGGDDDVDVVAAHRGLLVGVVGTPQNLEIQCEAGGADVRAAHLHAHGVAPPNACPVVDLAVHDLDVEAAVDQTRVRHAQMVEEAGAGLVEPGEVVAVEHHALLVDLRVPRHDREGERSHAPHPTVGENSFAVCDIRRGRRGYDLRVTGSETRQRPEDTVERRTTWWQRALRWIAWLTFFGLAVYNSQQVYFSPLEWLALAAAVGISIWCMAKPLGGPKYELREPSHLLGAFVSRTSWGLVLFGGILTVGGIAGSMAAIYDVSTGRATVGDVLRDVAVFVEGWIAELIAPTHDAELEKTHAYALFVLLIPGLLLLYFN